MGWINFIIFIILAIAGVWGMLSRAKWMKEQSQKNKKS